MSKATQSKSHNGKIDKTLTPDDLAQRGLPHNVVKSGMRQDPDERKSVEGETDSFIGAAIAGNLMR